MQIALIYTILAVLATAVNLLAQAATFWVYSGAYNLWLSILVGTAAGLIAKYVLDKRYIFKFKADSVSEDTWTFVMYTGTGVFTTCIFWGTEWLFDYIYNSISMRYVGGAVGLFVGYIIKYQLDKRFVFRSSV